MHAFPIKKSLIPSILLVTEIYEINFRPDSSKLKSDISFYFGLLKCKLRPKIITFSNAEISKYSYTHHTK